MAGSEHQRKLHPSDCNAMAGSEHQRKLQSVIIVVLFATLDDVCNLAHGAEWEVESDWALPNTNRGGPGAGAA